MPVSPSNYQNTLCALRETIRSYMDESRYAHTLAVETEAASLGMLYQFDEERLFRLRTAALLHDITKRDTTQKQLKYCEKFDIIVDKFDISSPHILHAKTAPAVAREVFGDELVNTEVQAGIRWHTTGREGMTLFESLLYLADFIEPTRRFDNCVRLRRYFYENPDHTADKTLHLRKTMCLSCAMSIRLLLAEDAPIHPDTIAARNYFLMEPDYPGTLRHE